MYGYDFMIDDLYNTWLIEINSSPSMEYSTVCKSTNIFTMHFLTFVPFKSKY